LLRSAHRGSLFLDEIGEMPPSLQVKLLRALQEREVLPLGATRAEAFDARIIAATNRNLEQESLEGRFRDDLFYRLSVFSFTLPPLRRRREDIPLLARFFVDRYSRSLGLEPRPVSDEAMHALINHEWRGNIRELQNAIERAVALADDRIERRHLPQKVQDAQGGYRDLTGRIITLEEIERRHILETLDLVGDDKTQAATLLGIDLSTLYRKLKRYGR
jgi:transcriptional regulator with PAS, ATPase and Fis domain